MSTEENDGIIEQFKRDLKNYDSLQIIRRRIIFGQCHKLHHDKYDDLRHAVANEFHVHPNEVLVVGSAKLGFSLAPSKRYRPFNDESDIDVVIVSSRLFDHIWKEVYLYEKAGANWDKAKEFKEYLFKGWIRPDKMPPQRRFSLCQNWWDFFRKLSSSGEYGDYKISGALYHSWFFLENYQEECVQGCRNALKVLNENISN